MGELAVVVVSDSEPGPVVNNATDSGVDVMDGTFTAPQHTLHIDVRRNCESNNSTGSGVMMLSTPHELASLPTFTDPIRRSDYFNFIFNYYIINCR